MLADRIMNGTKNEMRKKQQRTNRKSTNFACRLMTTLKLMASPNVGIIFHRNTSIQSGLHHVAACTVLSRAFQRLPTSTRFFSVVALLFPNFVVSGFFAPSFICERESVRWILLKCYRAWDRIWFDLLLSGYPLGYTATTQSVSQWWCAVH